MSANTAPIFTLTPHIEWAQGIGTGTANTATDGSGTLNTNIWSIFTATTNGSKVSHIRVKQLGTNVASLIRVFINNGSTNATPANSTLVAEIATPAITISQSANNLDQVYELDEDLPNGYRLLVTVATQVSGGFDVTALGGDY
jgi:hypothetical protein